MANETKNQIIISDTCIEFVGFPLLPETGTISVFHTENSFTIYPSVVEKLFYTTFEIKDKMIKKDDYLKEYAIFRTMIEEIKDQGEYLFVEYNDIYMIIP